MSWILVGLAGVLEVVWALGLKASAGLTRPGPVGITLVALAGSLTLLALGMRDLPASTAYATFVGVGVGGTVLVGAWSGAEPLTGARLGFLLLLLVALVGLKVTEGSHPGAAPSHHEEADARRDH